MRYDEDFATCEQCDEYCRDVDDLEGQVEDLEEDNASLKRTCDDLERELASAYELIKKSGVISDTPENQHNFSHQGLRWAILKYEESK